MPYNAIKQTTTFSDTGVVDATHSPVIATATVAASVQALSAGTILMASDDGAVKYVKPTDGSTVRILGVLVDDYDPARGNLANILRHGTVVRDRLDATAEEIADLEAQTPIFAL
jgi:hypothetical protein